MSQKTGRLNCPECEFWSGPDRPRERVSMFCGRFIFDVDKAKALIVQRDVQAMPVRVDLLKSWAQWPPPRRRNGKMTISLFGGGLNYKHLDHVDIEEPIIIAFSQLGCLDEPRAGIVIDGRHRLARAQRDGHREILAFILDGASTDAITTTPSESAPDEAVTGW